MARNRFFKKVILIFSVYFLTCNDEPETNSSLVIAELDTAITTIGEPVKYSFLIQKPENKIIKTNKLILKNSYEIDSLGFEYNDNFIKKTFQVTFWDTGQFSLPSLEIEVKWRGKWLELGGAGIFRPEVTEPLGITHPVLAWGMGLERLAMLVLGLDDIRQLYISDLEWLRNQPII